MLFFTRCFLCIGAVVVLAEGFSAKDLWSASHSAVSKAQGAITARIEDNCRQAPAQCLAVASAILKTGQPPFDPEAEPPLPPISPYPMRAGHAFDAGRRGRHLSSGPEIPK